MLKNNIRDHYKIIIWCLNNIPDNNWRTIQPSGELFRTVGDGTYLNSGKPQYWKKAVDENESDRIRWETSIFTEEHDFFASYVVAKKYAMMFKLRWT